MMGNKNLKTVKIKETLAPQVKEILKHFKDSPLLKEQDVKKIFLNKLKEIFHTTPRNLRTCDRCRARKNYNL